MKPGARVRKTASAVPHRPGARVTLEMVAEVARVSPATVSRVLNGTAKVSPEKRAAIEKAIASLDFVPNPIARGLAGGRTSTVGVVTQSMGSPFYGAALSGIEAELAAAGYSPLFVSGHWNAAAESACIDALSTRRVDGIILLTGRLGDQALRARARDLPVVVTGRKLRAKNLYSLTFDNFEGAQIGTRHLLELGHRRIAFIAGDPGHADANERLRGYREAIQQAGIRYDPALVLAGDFREESGLRAVDRLLDSRQKFSAIFAANDQMALGAALALYRRSIRVPDDVSLIGFDDLPASLYAIPPLSTVHQPAYELGELAARAMVQLLDGKKPSVDVPEPRFIVRESTRRIGR